MDEDAELGIAKPIGIVCCLKDTQVGMCLIIPFLCGFLDAESIFDTNRRCL